MQIYSWQNQWEQFHLLNGYYRWVSAFLLYRAFLIFETFKHELHYAVFSTTAVPWIIPHLSWSYVHFFADFHEIAFFTRCYWAIYRFLLNVLVLSRIRYCLSPFQFCQMQIIVFFGWRFDLALGLSISFQTTHFIFLLLIAWIRFFSSLVTIFCRTLLSLHMAGAERDVERQWEAMCFSLSSRRTLNFWVNLIQ